MTRLALAMSVAAATVVTVAGQRMPVDRLAAKAFDVLPPSARVAGEPGRMTVEQTACRRLPLDTVRRRIVDVAVQEWAYFGFTVVDQTEEEDAGPQPGQFRRRGLPPDQAIRVASSIAGYWAVTPEGRWIVNRQNEAWSGPDGAGARWRSPWSAAFVSWVMCESGLGDASRFRRAVAHHAYIDQAIRARDAATTTAGFTAHDVGEVAVAPGDLLCTARRPAYRSLAERRRQMGQGARTHCDVVVNVDETAGRYLAVGGNVRGSVSMKIIPAVRERGRMRPATAAEGGRTIFAHLNLRAPAIGLDALRSTPTMRAIACDDLSVPMPNAIASVVGVTSVACGD